MCSWQQQSGESFNLSPNARLWAVGGSQSARVEHPHGHGEKQIMIGHVESDASIVCLNLQSQGTYNKNIRLSTVWWWCRKSLEFVMAAASFACPCRSSYCRGTSAVRWK